MAEIIGVRFRPEDDIAYYNPHGVDLLRGDHCLAKSIYGEEIGRVIIGPKNIPADIDESFPRIIRKANQSDFKKMKVLEKKENEAFGVGKEKIKKHNLPMKLIKVRYTFDKARIIFYFVADSRVDFRELVKDLASVFRTRIEMRQVGVRDAAKILGGIGMCGREVCCRTFLFNFQLVSLRMAKEQNLSLNSEKITGICGRLKCCLGFEHAYYEELLKAIPPVGSKIRISDDIQGKIGGINIFNRTIFIDVQNGGRIEVPVEEVEKLKKL